MMDQFEKYLSDEAVEQFDRIVEEYERPLRHRRAIRWTSAVASTVAAIILAVFLFPRQAEDTPISSIIIVETINQLMSLNEDLISSIEAKPLGSKALLTVRLKDGGVQSYIMTLDEETGATCLTASNL